ILHGLQAGDGSRREVAPGDGHVLYIPLPADLDLEHGLELKVVAEGVETTEQLDFLKEQGCDEIQGYLLSPP
ncbi:EAL domain-containing protein, partial [Pseudomonas otitidis]